MKIYTYRSKKTGRIIACNKPNNSPDLVLVTRIANGQMKGNQIISKH
jgi:hypothetical protein